MANVLVEEQYLSDIASAIRTKNGLTTLYKPSEMANAVTNITDNSGGIIDRTISTPYVNSSVAQIGSYAFRDCTKLPSVDLGAATYISEYAFYNCMSLSAANIPSVSTISRAAFYNCGLLTISCQSVRVIGSTAFNWCTKLTSIYAPSCTTIIAAAFSSCYNLSIASFPKLSSIGASAFAACYKLLSLYLLGSSVCSLANINAFYSTPISTYTTSTGGINGSIYVPSSLYSSYISKTNWVSYSSRFVSM